MRQGDPFQGVDSHMYFILHGKFQVTIGNIVVRILEPGSHFGELALFTKGVRTASIQCLTKENLVLKLDYAKFLHLLNRFPDFAKSLKNHIDSSYLVEKKAVPTNLVKEV